MNKLEKSSFPVMGFQGHVEVDCSPMLKVFIVINSTLGKRITISLYVDHDTT